MRQCTARVLSALVVLWSMALSGAVAQIIPVKTVPMAEGDQFTFLPSTNRGMANVAIALPDSLFDPFVNPSTGERLTRSYFFTSPAVYALSRTRSSGSTLPLGGFARSGSLFLGAGYAVQKISPPGPETDNFVVLESSVFPGTTETNGDQTNQYAFGLIGVAAADRRPAFGASVQWSRLRGIEGAELLYPGSTRVDQLADALTLRAGMRLSLSSRQSIEMTLVHRRYSAAHDVLYREFVWNPATRIPLERVHEEQNYDRTHLWGAQLQHRRMLDDSTWTLGLLLTANRTTQPTTPVFGPMTVARDPGESSAINAGFGLSRARNGTTVALDAIYEPIWSRAREAPSPSTYRFSNIVLRGGASHDIRSEHQPATLRFQGGMQVRAVNYLRQAGELGGALARARRYWNEWLHTWSTSVLLDQFSVQYGVRVISGLQRPGIEAPSGGVVQPLDISFFPPFGPRTMLLPVRVTTHQLSLSVPVR